MENTDIPDAYPGEFIRVVIGSTVHGLSVAHTDDLDLMGVCLEPAELTLNMTKPFEQYTYRTQPDGHPSGPGDVDLTTYSLRKFLKLASNGNPTVINLLFVPPQYRYIDEPLAEPLRGLTPYTISKEAGARYLGYMRAQRERLLGLRGQKRSGYTRRLKYQSEAGWDTKYAMHLCRLAIQGIELLNTGYITFPVPEPHRSSLMTIRQGKWELEDVVKWSEDLEAELIEAREKSSLPEHPDRDLLNKWLARTYINHWTNNV